MTFSDRNSLSNQPTKRALISPCYVLLNGLEMYLSASFMFSISHTMIQHTKHKATFITQNQHSLSPFLSSPHGLLHLLCLPLCGDGQGNTQSSHSMLTDGWLRVPHGMEDNIKKLLHLLEEIGGHREGQLTQKQCLWGKG